MIRPAAPDDAPALASLHVRSWRETYAGLMPEPLLTRMTDSAMQARREVSWRQGVADPTQVVRLAEMDGQVVGLASGGPLRPHPGLPAEQLPAEYDAELYTLYLLRAAQGRGLGRRLVAEVAGGLGQQGFRGLALWVLAANPTRAFYGHLGGALLGQRTEETPYGELQEVAYGWQTLEALIHPAGRTDQG